MQRNEGPPRFKRGGPFSECAALSCRCLGERADKPGSVVGRPFISNVRRRTPQARNPNVRRATVSRSYLRLLRMGFSKPRRCRRAGALLPHRFSFSRRALRRGACAGEFPFLWHCPSGRPAQPLAGILPCGARTFLAPQCATAWPARVRYSSMRGPCSRGESSSAVFRGAMLFGIAFAVRSFRLLSSPDAVRARACMWYSGKIQYRSQEFCMGAGACRLAVSGKAFSRLSERGVRR